MAPPSRRSRSVTRLALGLGLLVALGWLKLRHGGGVPHVDMSTTPRRPATALEPVITLDFPPGNVAVGPDSRVFVNLHPFAQAARFGVPTVFEVVDGQPRPFPDAEAQRRWQGVFGMTIDGAGRLWCIEPASLDHARTRLTAWDLATRRLVFEHWFPRGVLRFAQDLRVTPDGQHVVLAETGLFTFTPPAIAVFTPATRALILRLQRHPSTQPKPLVTRTKHGPHRLAFGLVSFLVGVDGIALSQDGAWLHYAAMNHDRLYRVPFAALADPAVSETELARRIEDLGPKPLSDGITLDADGRVVLTDVEHGGLMRREPDGRLQTLVRDPRVIWADGVVAAPDGSLLFTDSAIPAYLDQLARPPSPERLAAGRPYRVWRLPPERARVP